MGNFVNKLELAQALQIRTKQFAIRIIGAFSDLPKTEASRVIGRQFVRSGTAIAANYRAACRARSQAEFVSKISIVVEETDETLFWLELVMEAQLVSAAKLEQLRSECTELLKIFSSSLTTAKSNR